MAITAALKRARLEQAWDNNTGNSLRAYLRKAEDACLAAINAGSVQTSTGNGHTVTFFGYGTGQITPLEAAELYRNLIDAWDNAFNFLSFCCQKGLDPFIVESNWLGNCYNSIVNVAPPILIDKTGNFATLVAQFGVDPTPVGIALNDDAIFIWLMYHIFAITEGRSNYSDLRLTGGGHC